VAYQDAINTLKALHTLEAMILILHTFAEHVR